MKKPAILTFYCDWDRCPDNMLGSCFAEFRDNGAENLVFSSVWMSRVLREPSFFGFLKNVARGKIRFMEMHSVYGESYDLASMVTARREGLIRDHIRSMQYAADLGCRTYTVHVGAYDSVVDHVPNEVLRPLAVESLEKLLPAAEKLGMIIAVENAFERSNTPEEVMYYVDHFRHPNIRCCFDCGHANIMDTFPGKGAYGHYMTDTVWSGRIEHCSDAFERMAPAMVTCHLHDNDGYSDQHMPPGMGCVDWELLAKKLRNDAPELLTIQTESGIFSKGVSIRDTVERFRRIFPELL